MATLLVNKRRDISALIDDGDLERVQSIAGWTSDGRYVYTRIVGRKLYLHRFLMGLERGDRREVDHINRDGLDNRRENLRVVTHRVNGKNVGSQGGTSQYRGVHWCASRRKWVAQAKYDYRHHPLGRYDSEEEAAEAVRAFWLERGDNAA